MKIDLQPFIFGFIVSLICMGGFTYLLHIGDGWELGVSAVGIAISVSTCVALGLTIGKVILDRMKAKKAKD